jgi:hypothetical protein
MMADLHPGHLFDRLVEGPQASGERDKGARPIEHGLLARMHARRDHKFMQIGWRFFAAAERGRDDSDRMSASLYGGSCDHAHKT